MGHTQTDKYILLSYKNFVIFAIVSVLHFTTKTNENLLHLVDTWKIGEKNLFNLSAW